MPPPHSQLPRACHEAADFKLSISPVGIELFRSVTLNEQLPHETATVGPRSFRLRDCSRVQAAPLNPAAFVECRIGMLLDESS